MQEYLDLLKSHDWFHEYSDDHSVWKRGREQRARLLELKGQYDTEYVYWNRYAPDHFKVNVIN